jgi:hypothetical protein
VSNTITLWFASSDGIAASLSLIGTVATVYLAHWLRGGVKLIAFSPNSTHFQIKQNEPNAPVIHVNSGQIIIQNDGRKTATDLQIVSKPGIPPAGYVLLPNVVHTTEQGPQNEWILRLPYLAPRENVTIQLLNGPLIDSVRCAEGPTKWVGVIHQRIFPLWFRALVVSLLIWGIGTALFAIISLLLHMTSS